MQSEKNIAKYLKRRDIFVNLEVVDKLAFIEIKLIKHKENSIRESKFWTTYASWLTSTIRKESYEARINWYVFWELHE